MDNFDAVTITITPSEFNPSKAQIFVAHHGHWIEHILKVNNYQEKINGIVKNYQEIYPECEIVLRNFMGDNKE